MKKLKNILFAMAAVMSIHAAKAQTADEILDKYIDAIGGKEKMMALKSIKMDGSMSVQGFDIGITITTVNATGSRTDISVPGMDPGFRIITPVKGWNYLPFRGQSAPEPASEEEIKAGQPGLDLQSPFLNYKEKGHQVELLGKEKSEGVECYKLKITFKNGKKTTVFFDAKTYYRIKTVSTSNINGQETEVETTYADFKKLPEGYVVPFTQVNPTGTITLSTVEVNKPVDESIFTVK